MIAFLNQAKKQHDDEIGSIKLRLSGRSKRSLTSSSSSKSKLMEAKAKAAALEIKAAFLEENVYKQFEMEQNIDGMNDYLETMKVK